MAHLVQIALGPVQDFIAAALRTRDLWLGSQLLSEVSKAAACALQEAGAELIFPAPRDRKALAPDSPLNVANILLATLEGPFQEAIDRAKKAAQGRLEDFIKEAEQRYQKQVRHLPLRQDIWEAQKEGLLEIFASAVPLQGNYAAARRRLAALTAARRNTRTFSQTTLDPFAPPGFGLPKSSLDARRETVLPEGLDERARRRLRLGEGEQLDLPGLVKRLAGPQERFTAVTRIAADPWLRRLTKEELERLGEVYEPLVGCDLATRVRGNEGCYQDFPYDGAFLYPDRLEGALKAYEDAREALEPLRATLRPLWKRWGAPESYYALLLADGDRMGRLLDQAQSPEAHRAISQALAGFAARVPGIVRECRGHCIYAGGDDVLALLPIDGALPCAAALYEAFTGALNATLSVGVAFAHVLEPLGRVRNLAKRAEKLAKEDRDALGILIEPRSGAPLALRRPFPHDPIGTLARWQEAFARGRLPDKLPYELRAIACRFDPSMEDFATLLYRELTLILAKKRTPGQAPLDAALVKDLRQAAQERGVQGLGEELLAARWLASHMEVS